MARKRPFYIVDPNLRNVGGHYFEYDRAVAEGATANGYETVILAHRDVEPTIAAKVGAHPVFTRDIWGLAGPGSRLAIAIGKLRDNFRFLVDLLGSIRRFGAPPGTVIFVHTFIDRQLLAIAVLPVLLWFKRDVRYVYLLRYQPDFYQDPFSAFAFRLIECLSRHRPIHLTTDSARLAEQLGRLSANPFHVLPIPHVPPEQPDTASAERDDRTTFVSLGNARDEKGIFEILAAIQLLHQRGQLGRMRFVLQCNDAAPDVRLAIDAFAAENIPNCELLFDKLESETYYKILWESDCVLLPYWRSIYFGRTSGVFMEALSAGKPVIATTDTWMSDQLAEHGAGLLCEDRSTEMLAALMLRAVANRDALSRTALANRKHWLETHNPGALARTIGELRAAPPAPASPPRRILILYPHDDFISRQGGASRRANLVAEFLVARHLDVRVLQGGTAPRTIAHGLTIESLGPEGSAPFHRSATGLLVWAASFGQGMKHRWMFWQYARVGVDKRFQRLLRQQIRWADIVVLKYPLWADAVIPIAHQEGRRVVLSAHDVLADQLNDLPVLRAVGWHKELRAWKAADALVSVSATDQAVMAGHGLSSVLTPNPTDGRLFEIERLGNARVLLRDLFGIQLPTRRVCLFVGSLFEPNVRAVASIKEIARAITALDGGEDVCFVIVGGCAPAERDGNFLALGRISDAALLLLYAACDLVLIPIPYGTGASLKTVEGMAAAKIVLGTAAAFRGLDIRAGREVLIEDTIAAYPERILAALHDADAGQKIAGAARDFARAYDSRVAFLNYLDVLGVPNNVGDHPVAAFGAIDPSLVEIARMALEKGHIKTALALATEALRTSPGDADAEAVLMLAEGRASAPVAEPEPMPENVPVPESRGGVDLVAEQRKMIDGLWALFHTGDYETLIPHIRGLLTQHANVADLHFLLAQSLHNSFQEPDRAEFHYTRAKVLGFDRYWVWRGRGRLRREQGRYALALRDFTLALIKQPFFPATSQNPQPRLESDPVAEQRKMVDGLWDLFHTGDYETLIPHIRALLVRHGDVADLHFILAQALHNSCQEPDSAEFHYTRAGVLGFDRYWVWCGRGRLRREQGHAALALRDFTLALMKRPFGPSTSAIVRQGASALRRWARGTRP